MVSRSRIGFDERIYSVPPVTGPDQDLLYSPEFKDLQAGKSLFGQVCGDSHGDLRGLHRERDFSLFNFIHNDLSRPWVLFSFT